MAKTYTIKQGDTLSSIAKQYGTSVSKLAKENNIADPKMIKSGATINIPQSVGGQVLKTVFSPVLTGGFTNLFPSETKQQVVTPTEVNLGATPIAPVKPVKEPVTVISYKDNPDGTKQGLTLKDLADKMEVSVATVSRWEKAPEKLKWG